VVSEEADESVFWYQRLVNAKISGDVAVDPLLDEAVQLAKIFAATYRTAKRRRSRRNDADRDQ
jgi:hypothetical protein